MVVTKDSFSTGSPSANNPIRFSATKLQGGGSFQAGSSYSLAEVDITLKKFGSPTGNVYVELYAAGSRGIPTGSVLATSNNNDVSTVSTAANGAAMRFVFASPYALTSGNSYALIVNGTWTVSSTNYVRTVAGSSTGWDEHSWNATTWVVDASNWQVIFTSYAPDAVASGDALFFGGGL